MSQHTVNQTYKKQQGRLVAATFKRGIVQNVNQHSATADVQVLGNQTSLVKGVPMASHIIPALVQQGDRCRLDMFDETNPNDMVVAYIYGRTIAPITSGGLFNTSGGTFQIPHGLGVVPAMFYANIDELLVVSGNRTIVTITSVDSTYINCTCTTSGTSFDVLWWATTPG